MRTGDAGRLQPLHETIVAQGFDTTRCRRDGVTFQTHDAWSFYGGRPLKASPLYRVKGRWIHLTKVGIRRGLNNARNHVEGIPLVGWHVT